jgi:DNA-binding transcriptional MerR regulator
MKRFSTKQLEQFSGVKAHTIRVWEKRFRILKPARSKGNTRNYDIEEVKLLLDFALLNRNGFQISVLANMNTLQVDQEIDALDSPLNKQAKAVNRLIYFMFSSAIEDFEMLLDESVVSLGIDTTITDVIIPFLEKTNLLSYDDTSNEVHFAVTAIRKKIIVGIEHVTVTANKEKAAVLFLPEKEHYDLMLLYMAYIVKSYGVKVYYLGTNISEENIYKVAKEKKPDILLSYVTPRQEFKLHTFFKEINQHLPETKLLITGSGELSAKQENKNVKFVHYRQLQSALSLIS